MLFRSGTWAGLNRSVLNQSVSPKQPVLVRKSLADVGGQRCPDSARVNCTVYVRQNLKFSVRRVFECPDFEFELDFDRQTPVSDFNRFVWPPSEQALIDIDTYP